MNGYVRAMFASSRVQMMLAIKRPFFRFAVLVQPLLLSFLMCSIFRYSTATESLSFIVFGTAMMNLWSSIVFSSLGDIDRERFLGTLELLFSVPVPFGIILFGKILGNMLWGIWTVLETVLFSVLLLRVELRIADPRLFILALAFILLSCLVLSILFSCIFALSRKVRLFMNAMENPIYILCGFAFPILLLPTWLRPFSYFINLTYAVDLLRTSITGKPGIMRTVTEITLLACINAVYIVFSVLLLNKLKMRAQQHASLGAY